LRPASRQRPRRGGLDGDLGLTPRSFERTASGCHTPFGAIPFDQREDPIEEITGWVAPAEGRL
jgi:hypothetical protein